MKKKKIKRDLLFVGGLLGFLLFCGFIFHWGFMLGNNSNPVGYTIQDSCLACNKVYGLKDTYYTSDYFEMLDRIKDSCDSTFFVYRDVDTDWRTEQFEWTLFRNVCNSDGFCKPAYVDLEDCLK